MTFVMFLTLLSPQFLLAESEAPNSITLSDFDKTPGQSVATFVAVLMALMALRLHASKRRALQDLKLASAVIDRTKDLERDKQLAEEATQHKSQFLANIGSEINVPARTLVTLIDKTLKSKLTPEQRTSLELSRKSAEHLQTLADDILEFSKGESRYMTVEQSMFSINYCVHGAVATLTARAAEAGIGIRSEIGVEIPDLLIGDAGRLRQLIIRLLDHAIKSPSSRQLLLTVESERREGISDSSTESSRTVLFSLYNNGLPIYREAAGKHDANELTMTICGRLVRMLGGRIWQDKDADGCDRFFFTAKFEVAVTKGPAAPINPNQAVGKFA